MLILCVASSNIAVLDGKVLDFRDVRVSCKLLHGPLTNMEASKNVSSILTLIHVVGSFAPCLYWG